MTARSISLFDLMSDPLVKKVIKEENKEELNKILYKLGFDITQEIEYVDCFHRPLTQKGNDPVYGTMIMGEERRDPVWLQSGNASWEQRIAMTEDANLRFELRSMGCQGSVTGEQCKQIAKSKVKVENNL